MEKPKAREVYAAQFQDRVVHHLLVPWLEQLLDSHFIYDAASNRKRKGTHFAVNRLQSFMRSRQGKGWFLQLDIASFFNSIHQGILLEILSNKLQKTVRRGCMLVCKDMQTPIQTLGKQCAAMRRQGLGYAVITEQGYLRGWLKRRIRRQQYH